MTQDGQAQNKPFKVLELDFLIIATRPKEEYVRHRVYILLLKHATQSLSSYLSLCLSTLTDIK